MAIETITSPSAELVRRYFVCQDERPDEVEEVAIGVLEPFLRNLLFTDGTVTRALAVQGLAPVCVHLLSQEEISLPAEATPYLEAEAGASSVRRRVEIGPPSAPLLWAESHLLPGRLPPAFFGELRSSAEGIGQSLQRLENYRELLWFGVGALPAWAPAGEARTSIRRLYRLFSQGRPAILIAESFLVERDSGGYALARTASSHWSGGSENGGAR